MEKIFRELIRDIKFSKREVLNYPPHIHSDIEMVFMRKGTTKAFCNGEEYLLRPNDIFIAFPNQVHYYSDCSEDCDSLLLIMNPSLVFGYTDIFLERTPVCSVYTPTENDLYLYEIIELAFKESQINPDKNVIFALATAVFGKLLKGYTFQDINSSNASISKILKYCAANFREDITVKDISREFNISESHISHTFNNKLKVTFSDYINSLRLIEAARLLRDKNLTITQISFMCGFGTIRTFNRVFYKHYGTTPSKYRQK